MSARRSKTKFTQIHVSIPVTVLAEFDYTLAFNDSRSRKITNLIKNHLESDTESLSIYSKEELLEAIQFRVDKDSPEDVLIESLLQILSK